MRALAVATVLALVCAASARAHEGGAHQGFASRVSTIDPFVPGLLVSVVGGHEQLSVTNLTDMRIVILDGGGEQFVRIAPGKTERWTEPRVGADEEPPEKEGLVRSWRIEGTSDGKPFAILGFLGYRAPAGSNEDGGSSAIARAVVLAGGAATLAVVAFAAMRLRRRT